MREIRKVDSYNIIDFITHYFPNFKISNSPFEFTYAYYLDGKVIGFINFSLIYEKAEINYIAVDDKYRRQGIGQELFDYFISNVSVDTISLEVNCSNEKAINFYLKNGFIKEAIRKNYYNSDDAYLMVKKLEVN